MSWTTISPGWGAICGRREDDRRGLPGEVDFETAQAACGLEDVVKGCASAPRASGGGRVEEAFRAFAARQTSTKSVRRQARLLGVPDDVAADMTQEALTRLWDRLATVAPARWPGWLQKTMLREALHRSRDRRRARRYEPAIAFELSLQPLDPSPEVELHLRECDLELTRLLDLLRPERREVVQLYLMEELPMKEVATRLGIPENTAKNRWRLAQQDMSAAFRRSQAKERFAAIVAPVWAFFVALWRRIRRWGAGGRGVLAASATVVLVLANREETAHLSNAMEVEERLPTVQWEYRFTLPTRAFAEPERAAAPVVAADRFGEAPRMLLARAAAALQEGNRDIARSCLSQYRAAYGSPSEGRFAAQYRALEAEIASR